MTVASTSTAGPSYTRHGPPPPPAAAVFYRVTDLMARWRCSRTTVYRLIDRLGLKAGRLGKNLMVSAEDVVRVDEAILSGALSDFPGDTSAA